MRLPARFFAAIAYLAVLCLSAAGGAQSQSSSSQSAPATTGESETPAQAGNGTYISVNPLAGVNYNNRFDVSLGMAYDHMKAGPTLLQGANLGGITLDGSYWLSRRWGLEGSFRPYFGTSGAGTGTTGQNVYNLVRGPFVSEYFFTAGPEWLGPHNQHGDLMAHVLVGGVYGNFEKDLRGLPPSAVDFYNNQVAPAVIMGGHMDLNRSARWVFRITPDAVMTRYGINYGNKITQTDINFAISVGLEYKFQIKRR
jgi:hypothetical protein